MAGGRAEPAEDGFPGRLLVDVARLRVPLRGEADDLLLRDDVDWLTENGYLYARGIRNAFGMAFDPEGELFGVSNSSDYDHPEEMFWIREGRHYGFPWTMGGIENPQQYPDFNPDPDEDPFINRYSHAYSVGYFHNDPGFPEPPPGVVFTPPVANATSTPTVVDGAVTATAAPVVGSQPNSPPPGQVMLS